MKQLLSILFLLLACSYSLAQAQLNYLTREESKLLRVNDIPFPDLEKSKGQISVLEGYFGTPKKVIEGEGGMEENWRSLEFEDITLSFNNIGLEGFTPFIYYIEARSISFKGKKISLGDPTSVLGSDIVMNTNRDNTKSVLIDYGNCCTFIIQFDQETKLVTKITYHVWT